MDKVLVLTVATGPQQGKTYTLGSRGTKIGSAPDNDLVLQERGIEPRHLEVQQAFERWFVVPLLPNGRGASLNGMPLTSRSRVNAGDRLTLGLMTYSVAIVEALSQEVGAAPTASNVPRLGAYFVRRGMLSNDQVGRIVQRQNELEQRGRKAPFGQVAHDLGFISRLQLDAALADQRNDFDDRFQD